MSDPIWFSTDVIPEENTPILVRWKTRGEPEQVENAYDMSDDFWFAEVSSWRYVEEN